MRLRVNCPPDVAVILLEILHHGIVHARLAGWRGDAERAALEADHIHNLPHLLQTFSLDKLNYYWEVERPCYAKVAGEEARLFNYWWEQLRVCVERLNEGRNT
jgi:hypothetical protein